MLDQAIQYERIYVPQNLTYTFKKMLYLYDFLNILSYILAGPVFVMGLYGRLF